MQSQTRPDEPVLSQEQSAPQPSSSSADQSYREVDIGEPYAGGTSGSTSTGDPAINHGGGNQK